MDRPRGAGRHPACVILSPGTYGLVASAPDAGLVHVGRMEFRSQNSIVSRRARLDREFYNLGPSHYLLPQGLLVLFSPPQGLWVPIGEVFHPPID